MANTLDSLLAKIEDAELSRQLKAEIEARSVGTGLVWEHHEPETVDLHSLPVAKGRHVRLLPPRGVDAEKLAKTIKGRKQIDPMWGRLGRVADIDKVCSGAARMARVVLDGDSVEVEWCAEDLVCVAGADEPIYPVLTKTGEVRRGGDDDPEHAVINGENYHALQLLATTHAGKLDLIYIDPPYNTGDRGWKYNNDFFDRADTYRHSKWLAFMERRLKLAKELLNPEDSVLIVTIDEKEVLRLGLLLEQVFPEARMQMISITIRPGGVHRRSAMSRVNEFAFYVYIGAAGPVPQPDSRVSAKAAPPGGDGVVAQWRLLRRSGSNSNRGDSTGCFYPVYVDPISMKIAEVGDPIPDGSSTGPEIPGLVQVLPISKANGQEKRWQMTPANLRSLIDLGYAKVGSYNSKTGRYSLLYLGRSQRAQIESGELVVVGQDANGVKDVREQGQRGIRKMPKTVWAETAHDAGPYGTSMIESLHGEKRFTFPKSLYAVEDCLRVVLENKPEATILDFFSGSGTTAHAVMRLNKQDGGKRRSISVTNNEVSADERKMLIERGLRPGDTEWESLGIANHVTGPRLQAAITGRTAVSGFTEPIKGRYKFVDEFDMADGIEANATFWTMNYLDPAHVEEDINFEILGGK